MKFYLIIKIIVAMLLALPIVANAETKIGFVNMIEIMEKSPQADAARKALEDEFSGRDKELTEARDQILKLEDTLKKDGAIMSDSKRTVLEKEVVNKKREYNRQQDELREDFNIRRNETLGNLQKNVHKVIVEFAKSKNYDLVVTQPVLFASSRIDLTEHVLQELKSAQ